MAHSLESFLNAFSVLLSDQGPLLRNATDDENETKSLEVRFKIFDKDALEASLSDLTFFTDNHFQVAHTSYDPTSSVQRSSSLPFVFQNLHPP